MHVTSRTFIKLPTTSKEPESQQHRGINASLPPKDLMTPSDVTDITDGAGSFRPTRSASSNLRCAPPNVRQTRSKSRPVEPNVRRQTRSKSHPRARPEANPSINSRSPGFTQKQASIASSRPSKSRPNLRQSGRTRSKSRQTGQTRSKSRQTRSKSRPLARPEANPSVKLRSSSRSSGFTQKQANISSARHPRPQKCGSSLQQPRHSTPSRIRSSNRSKTVSTSPGTTVATSSRTSFACNKLTIKGITVTNVSLCQPTTT